jgi:opacity protein-like surface antigen
MKKIFLISFSLFAFTIATAQIPQIIQALTPKKKFEGKPILTKGAHVLQFTIGVANTLNQFLDFGGVANIFKGNGAIEKNTGPIHLQYEYFLKPNYSIGAFISYAKTQQTYDLVIPIINSKIGNVNGQISLVQLAISNAYHLYTTNKIDPYIKAGVGINIWKGSYINDKGVASKPFTAPSPFSYQGLVGLKYFINKQWALVGEASYSNLKFTGNIGIAYKL